jgi:hypothetical protein
MLHQVRRRRSGSDIPSGSAACPPPPLLPYVLHPALVSRIPASIFTKPHSALRCDAAVSRAVLLLRPSVLRGLERRMLPISRPDNGTYTHARIGYSASSASSSTPAHVLRVQQHAAAHDRSAARPQQQQQQQQQRRRKAKQMHALEMVEELNADATSKRQRTDASSAPSSSSSSSSLGPGAAASSSSMSLVRSGGKKAKRAVKAENGPRV